MENIKAFVKENKQHVALLGLIFAAMTVILIAILAWKLPVIPVCFFVLLEAGLAVCLYQLPIGFHGAVLIAQLLVGLILGNGIFIMTSAAYYVVSIFALSLCDKK